MVERYKSVMEGWILSAPSLDISRIINSISNSQAIILDSSHKKQKITYHLQKITYSKLLRTNKTNKFNHNENQP